MGASVASPSGTAYRILYPGRLNGSGGPDYRDAVLQHGSQTLLGDVELHVRASDWRRHGHERDHAYDGVVLHVVLADDCGGHTALACGTRVPVAVADVAKPGVTVGILPCAHMYSACSSQVLDVLEDQGIARLLHKSRLMAMEMQREDEQHLLLRLVARALGYSCNTGPAEKVARILSDAPVSDVLKHGDAMQRRALVLGIAGLLPFQRNADGVCKSGEFRAYEVVWRQMCLESRAVLHAGWQLGSIYPNNHPVRRMISLADLLPVLPHLMEEVRRMACVTGDMNCPLSTLEKLLLVPGDPYWRTHYDFGRATRCSNLVGREKAREIVVNALVPLAFADAMSCGGVRRLARLSTAMRAYPACSQNAVTRHMRMQLGIDRVAMPAVQAQGLLRIFYMYCTRGLCEECPLGQFPTAL